MKSSRRHELQHNTLDTELAKGLTWIRNHGTKLAMALLAIALVILVGTYFYNSYRQSQQEQTYQLSAWLLGASLQGLDEERKAELAEGDDFQAYQGKLLLGREAMKAGFDKLTQGSGPEEIRTLREKAMGHFQAVTQGGEDYPLLAAQAHYGLVVIYEDRGEFAKAQEHCQAILDLPQLNTGYFLYDWAARKKRDLKQSLGKSRKNRLISVVPLRSKVRARAGSILFALSRGEAQGLEGLLAEENTVAENLEKISKAIEVQRPEIFDLHVGSDQAKAISDTISQEEQKTSLVLDLVRKEETWLLTSAQVKSLEDARKELEQFRTGNP